MSEIYRELDYLREQELRSRSSASRRRKNQQGAFRRTYLRVYSNKESRLLPYSPPWDFCIDRRWFERVGSVENPDETGEWFECGNPEGYRELTSGLYRRAKAKAPANLDL